MLADGAANEPLAALRDLVQPPDGMAADRRVSTGGRDCGCADAAAHWVRRRRHDRRSGRRESAYGSMTEFLQQAECKSNRLEFEANANSDRESGVDEDMEDERKPLSEISRSRSNQCDI